MDNYSNYTPNYVSLASQLPSYVGYWEHYGCRISLIKKPRLLTRLMFKFFFEINWVDK